MKSKYAIWKKSKSTHNTALLQTDLRIFFNSKTLVTSMRHSYTSFTFCHQGHFRISISYLGHKINKLVFFFVSFQKLLFLIHICSKFQLLRRWRSASTFVFTKIIWNNFLNSYRKGRVKEKYTDGPTAPTQSTLIVIWRSSRFNFSSTLKSSMQNCLQTYRTSVCFKI